MRDEFLIIGSLLLSLSILISSAYVAFAADDIIVSSETGKAYVRNNDGQLFPAGVIFTTDGNSNIQPVFSTNSTFNIGSVNQGFGGSSSSPWFVSDDVFKIDFDAWKGWADINLSTRAADSSIQTLIGKFTNTTGGAVKIDGSAFTQPISGSVSVSNFPASQTVNGTVTVNIGTTGGISLDTTSQTISTAVSKLPIAQGTALGSNSQVMSGGSVTTSTPTYVSGQISPISLTTSGALRTDSTSTTQPISGTITANAGTGNFNVIQSTGTNLHTVVDSGSVTANIGTTNGLALDSSVAKLNIAQGAAIGSNTQTLMGGSVTTVSPTYTTGQVSPLNLTTAGALRVDASATTQPVSGTVAATQSGNFNVRNQDGNGNLLSSQLSGAQRALDIGINVSGIQVDPRSIRALTSADVVTANAGSGSFTVVQSTGTNLHTVVDSGTVSATQSGTWNQNLTQVGGSNVTLGQKTAANSIPITLASDNYTAASIATTSTAVSLPISVRPPLSSTYASYSAPFTPPATPTDLCTLTGSATKVVRITNVEISGTTTTGAVGDFYLVKRSTANTGGTSTALNVVPFDSTNSSGTATAVNYTANPTLGTSLGNIRHTVIFLTGTIGASLISSLNWEFDNITSSQIILRGIAQQLSLNFNGAALPGGLSVRCGFNWIEE